MDGSLFTVTPRFTVPLDPGPNGLDIRFIRRDLPGPGQGRSCGVEPPLFEIEQREIRGRDRGTRRQVFGGEPGLLGCVVVADKVRSSPFEHPELGIQRIVTKCVDDRCPCFVGVVGDEGGLRPIDEQGDAARDHDGIVRRNDQRVVDRIECNDDAAVGHTRGLGLQ